MHYNVDKALLVGGKSRPSYNGGKVYKPIEFIIAGRATMDNSATESAIKDLAAEAVSDHFDNVIRFLDVDKHLKVKVRIRQGSGELVELYKRLSKGEVPLSNDTSIGTGFYPFDELESTVYKTEKLLNSETTKKDYPYLGEDIKVMGIRENNDIRLTIAVAIVDRFISDIEDYKNKISDIHDLISCQEWIKPNYTIFLNTADSYNEESIYITVTGTSAEHGDDGQVGRGNRANGLITPYRPMTMEAVSGKNPISHVGKIYNIFASELSRSIVENGFGIEASVNIVSQIGKPVTQPQITEIRVKDQTVNGSVIIDMAKGMLESLPDLWKRIIKGEFVIS